MDNNFLRQFLQARASTVEPKTKSTAKTVRNGAREMPEPTGMSIQTIIEELPDKKAVLEYFKQRIKNIEDEEFEE